MPYRIEVRENVWPEDYLLTMYDANDNRIGCVGGDFKEADVRGSEGKAHFTLDILLVPDKKHRNKGLGSQLLKEFEKLAQQKGATYIMGHFGHYSESGFDSVQDHTAALTNFYSKKHDYNITDENFIKYLAE